MDEVTGAVFQLVRAKGSFLITGHERPDGDIFGTGVALKAILEALGKRARLVLPDPVPQWTTTPTPWSFIRSTKSTKRSICFEVGEEKSETGR